MEIDYIKWLVSYAEKWDLDINGDNWSIRSPQMSSIFNEDDITNTERRGYALWHNMLYPLLLQKAIEGINKEEGFELIQTRSNIIVYDFTGAPPLNFELEPDNEIEAKEEVLKYIYNQEMKDGD